MDVLDLIVGAVSATPGKAGMIATLALLLLGILALAVVFLVLR